MTPEETFNQLKEPAPIVDEDGDKYWLDERGELHRENGLPAIVCVNGIKVWYIHGTYIKREL